MAGLPIQKRPNDLFVSYSHADTKLVDPIVDWLRQSAGLSIWYDSSSGNASKRTTALLSEAVQSARGALVVLSSNWNASTWCQDEHEVALTERRADDSYFVVAIRLDDSEIPTWFTIADIVDFQHFDSPSCVRLLRSMAPNAPARYDNDQDVYLAGPWSRPSAALKPALKCLNEMGWRLVGDSPDNPHFRDSATRISSIIKTARGLVALLPFDPTKPPAYTSPWIIEEIRIAQGLEKLYLLLTEEGVQLLPELASGAFTGRPACIPHGEPDASFRQIFADFDDELARRPHDDARSYSFLATSLRDETKDIDDLGAVMERVSNMKCVRGVGLSGQHVQEAITDRIRNAGFVIADVTDDHRNTLIEAGIALGAGVPLHLLSRPPSDGSLKRRFMFEDREMNWYQSPVERLGIVYRIGKGYRRRVLTGAGK